MIIGANPVTIDGKDENTTQENTPSILLFLLCGFGIVLFSNSVSYLLTPDGAVDTGILKILRLLIYTIFIGAFFISQNKKDILFSIGPFLLGLLALASISVIWSISPKDTIIRTYGLMGTTMMAGILAANFSWRNFLRLSLYSYLLIILITVAVCIFFPDIGRHYGDDHSGAWRGAFGHKNAMGRAMLCGFVLMYFCSTVLSGKEKFFARMSMACALFLIILSTSMTVLVSLILIICLSRMMPIIYKNKTTFVSLFLFALIFLLFLFTFVDVDSLIAALFNQAGRDITLTGRTDIWKTAIQLWLSKNALLGFGYGGFWGTTVGNQSVYWGLSYFTNYIPPHAHNGFIQVATELGFVGLILTFLYLVSSLKGILKYIPAGAQNINYAPFILFTLCLLLNLTEVNFLVNRNIIWVFLVYSAARATLELKQAELDKGSLITKVQKI